MLYKNMVQYNHIHVVNKQKLQSNNIKQSIFLNILIVFNNSNDFEVLFYISHIYRFIKLTRA
jgi:hypothetical protein